MRAQGASCAGRGAIARQRDASSDTGGATADGPREPSLQPCWPPEPRRQPALRRRAPSPGNPRRTARNAYARRHLRGDRNEQREGRVDGVARARRVGVRERGLAVHLIVGRPRRRPGHCLRPGRLQQRIERRIERRRAGAGLHDHQWRLQLHPRVPGNELAHVRYVRRSSARRSRAVRPRVTPRAGPASARPAPDAFGTRGSLQLRPQLVLLSRMRVTGARRGAGFVRRHAPPSEEYDPVGRRMLNVRQAFSPGPSSLGTCFARQTAVASPLAVGTRFQSDLPARLDRLPWSPWHWRATLALGITWTLDGLEVTLVGALGGVLRQSPRRSPSTCWESAAPASAYLAGAIVGALLFGRWTDRFGRRRLFLVTLSVYLLRHARDARERGASRRSPCSARSPAQASAASTRRSTPPSTS